MMKPYKSFFTESSWSRIIQHIEAGHSFAVISAYKWDLSETDNTERHNNLRTDIRKLGYGYIEQNSGYSYKDTRTGNLGTVEEESFFIPQITRQEALALAKKYEQESIIYKDGNGFYVLLSNGAIDTEFKTKRDKTGQITFSPEVIKHAFSQLKKASAHQRQQKFAYVIKECVWTKEYHIPNRSDAYRGIKENKIPEAQYIKIF